MYEDWSRSTVGCGLTSTEELECGESELRRDVDTLVLTALSKRCEVFLEGAVTASVFRPVVRCEHYRLHMYFTIYIVQIILSQFGLKIDLDFTHSLINCRINRAIKKHTIFKKIGSLRTHTKCKKMIHLAIIKTYNISEQKKRRKKARRWQLAQNNWQKLS